MFPDLALACYSVFNIYVREFTQMYNLRLASKACYQIYSAVQPGSVYSISAGKSLFQADQCNTGPGMSAEST